MNLTPKLVRSGGMSSVWKAGCSRLGHGIENRLLHVGHGSYGSVIPSKVKLDKGREVKWCSCGKTGQQPFCDSCNACNGKPVMFKALETKEYAFCNCKSSKNKPFCDGSHAKLQEA